MFLMCYFYVLFFLYQIIKFYFNEISPQKTILTTGKNAKEWAHLAYNYSARKHAHLPPIYNL